MPPYPSCLSPSWRYLLSVDLGLSPRQTAVPPVQVTPKVARRTQLPPECGVAVPPHDCYCSHQCNQEAAGVSYSSTHPEHLQRRRTAQGTSLLRTLGSQEQTQALQDLKLCVTHVTSEGAPSQVALVRVEQDGDRKRRKKPNAEESCGREIERNRAGSPSTLRSVLLHGKSP
ncbi:hypothetical protein AV530_020192 [Patagioenas fasciata monilis]|uniref:Uncharacterized protein n=1 Tax=Patagioenas fasciata monilis TaxID=372326 RepID=A0A1V4KZT0_PATFA|nr:hypothetical protein AV530_020192 [Patagioenas fasciata monilis]